MTTQVVLSLVLFAVVTSITPGPNNIMVLSSGMNYGVRRTIPHLLGISIGFGVLVFAVGFGLAQVFTAVPASYLVLRIVGGVYLVWLAYQIATAAPPSAADPGSRPMTFFGAAAFQWVNPKAWVMAVGAIANFAPAEAGVGVLVFVALIYAVINCPCVAVWAVFGRALRAWLRQPRHLRIFNYVMAAALLATLIPMLTTQL